MIIDVQAITINRNRWVTILAQKLLSIASVLPLFCIIQTMKMMKLEKNTKTQQKKTI